MTTYPTANVTYYNGWTNYATWAVNLWIDNDESLQAHARGMAKMCRDNPETYVSMGSEAREGCVVREVREPRFTLADRLAAWVSEDLIPDLGPCLAADLLGFSLASVDWQEIAGVLLSE